MITLARFTLGKMYAKLEVDDNEEFVKVVAFMGDKRSTAIFDYAELSEAKDTFIKWCSSINYATSRSMLIDCKLAGGINAEERA